MFAQNQEINRSVTYNDQPVNLEKKLTERGIKLAGWDFDGTIADTERLHRVTFHTALEELSGATFSSSQLERMGFRAAFGLPEAETCAVIARSLARHHPDLFQTALEASLRLPHSLGHDFVSTVAAALRTTRGQVFEYYVNRVNTSLSDVGQLALSIPIHYQGRSGLEERRLELLRSVQVTAYPFVPEVLALLETRGITQGVCTSSSQRFVDPLLEKFGFLKFFRSNVYVDSVPDGRHKPDPYPFMLLAERLRGNAEEIVCPAPADDMIRFENSAGGALSATRAGKGITIVKADNSSSVIGKYQQKRIQHAHDHPHVVVEGESIFVPCFSVLLPDSVVRQLRTRRLPPLFRTPE